MTAFETGERVSGISVPPNNKKNWREGNGRPKGSSQQKKQVEEWQTAHPEGTPKDCIDETGISKNTVCSISLVEMKANVYINACIIYTFAV